MIAVCDKVIIHAPGYHTKHGQTGTVVGTPDTSYWGFYSVRFEDDSSGDYSFLPSELTKPA